VRGEDKIRCGAEKPHARLRRMGHPKPKSYGKGDGKSDGDCNGYGEFRY